MTLTRLDLAGLLDHGQLDHGRGRLAVQAVGGTGRYVRMYYTRTAGYGYSLWGISGRRQLRRVHRPGRISARGRQHPAQLEQPVVGAGLDCFGRNAQ
jgi:hypothetical protein